MRVMHYACGGGLGHLNRTLALVRQLSGTASSQKVVTNCRFAPSLQTRVEDAQFEILDGANTTSSLVSINDNFAPDLLVVDTFPRGIVGELVEFLSTCTHSHRVLTGRTLSAPYVEAHDIVSFARQNFDLIIEPGELSAYSQKSDLADGANVVSTKPWLIRSAEELPDRKESARCIGIEPELPTVFVVGSGNAREMSEAAGLAQLIASDPRFAKAQICFAAPDIASDGGTDGSAVASREMEPSRVKSLNHWPLIEGLPAADLVIGAAGYNLAAETTALQTPRILMPQNRLYDDQFGRLTNEEKQRIPGSVAELLDLADSFLQDEQGTRSTPGFVNGAVDAAAILKQALTESLPH